MATVLTNTIDRTGNPLVMLAAMLAMGLERLIVFLATLLAVSVAAVFAVVVAIVRHWRPLALAAGMVGIFALCFAVPALPVGIGITAAVAWATYPRT